jgi:hypothetical protein
MSEDYKGSYFSYHLLEEFMKDKCDLSAPVEHIGKFKNELDLHFKGQMGRTCYYVAIAIMLISPDKRHKLIGVVNELKGFSFSNLYSVQFIVDDLELYTEEEKHKINIVIDYYIKNITPPSKTEINEENKNSTDNQDIDTGKKEDYIGPCFSFKRLSLFLEDVCQIKIYKDRIKLIGSQLHDEYFSPNNISQTSTIMYMAVGMMVCCDNPSIVLREIKKYHWFKFDSLDSIEFLIALDVFSPIEKERINKLKDYYLNRGNLQLVESLETSRLTDDCIKKELDFNTWMKENEVEIGNARLVTIANNGQKCVGVYDVISNQVFILG